MQCGIMEINMNFRMIRYITAQLLIVEGLFMTIPLAVTLIYREYAMLPSFLIPMGIMFLLGGVAIFFKPKNKTLGAKEGFIIVGLSWIIMSLFGCLPFVISKLIPNFLDAYFETVSGFTTTGASVLTSADFDNLWNPLSPELGMRGIFLWRSFTNWIGGMGVLVFILAIMPQQDMKSSRLMHVMRAEMPGPKVDKLVATVKRTAAIMYGIYIAMTLLQTIMLLLGGMDLYEALTTSFSTAGTGGFAIWPDSMATFGGNVAHPEYCTWVITVFMLLFSINFNLYYLILTGKVLSALFSEELRWFLVMVLLSGTAIAVNIYEISQTTAGCIRDAFFQVATVVSTTGFATADFNLWPGFSKTLLLILMFIGACAGSTGGGIKVGRIIIAVKGTLAEVKKMIHPRRVSSVRFENKTVDKDTINGSYAFLIMYAIIFFLSFFLISLFDGRDFEVSFSAVAACINNIGPGFGEIGPTGNFALLSYASKFVLTIDMLLGRLEIFPILLLFSVSVWRDK